MLKAISKTDNGKFAVGKVFNDFNTIEFSKQYEQEFDSVEEAEDFLYSKCSREYVRADYGHFVPLSFLRDIERLADQSRALLDEFCEKLGIERVCYTHYERQVHLQCYGGRTEARGIEEARGKDGYIGYVCENNYLEGLARGVYEMGVTLCWNTETKKHECHGRQSLIIHEAKEID